MNFGTLIFFTLAVILFILPFIYWAVLNGSERIATAVKYKWRTIFFLWIICWPLSALCIVASWFLFGPEGIFVATESIELLKAVFI